jgi:23S rRNA U2552 (ribose-2'-O)-methylase RlmE/FtsJ
VWIPQDREEDMVLPRLATLDQLALTWATKDRMDTLFDHNMGADFYTARNAVCPSDAKGSQKYYNRAAEKLEAVLEAAGIVPAPAPCCFVDVCGGPGSFSQYFLNTHRETRGWGMTLDSVTVKRNNLAWYPKLLRLAPRFQAVTGEPTNGMTGDIYQPQNLDLLVEATTGSRISYVVADGGFGISTVQKDGETIHQENLQELFSLHIIASEVLAALRLLADGGHFVCKVCLLFF